MLHTRQSLALSARRPPAFYAAAAVDSGARLVAAHSGKTLTLSRKPVLWGVVLVAVVAALALALRGNLFATALQWLKSRLSEWSDRHKTESDKKWGPSNTIAATSNALPSVRRPQPAKVALSEVDKRKLDAQLAALDSMKKPPLKRIASGLASPALARNSAR